MIIAVQLQITMVSINTPKACNNPAFAGCPTSAAAAGQGDHQLVGQADDLLSGPADPPGVNAVLAGTRTLRDADAPRLGLDRQGIGGLVHHQGDGTGEGA